MLTRSAPRSKILVKARGTMESRHVRRCSAQFVVTNDGRENFAQRKAQSSSMDASKLFGLFAVTAMLAAYSLEDLSHWFHLAVAGACALGRLTDFCRARRGSAGRGDLGRCRVAALVCRRR